MIQGGAYPILSYITPATTVILIEENEEYNLGEILENPCEEDDDFAISFDSLSYVDTNNNVYYVCDDFEFIYEYRLPLPIICTNSTKFSSHFCITPQTF